MRETNGLLMNQPTKFIIKMLNKYLWLIRIKHYVYCIDEIVTKRLRHFYIFFQIKNPKDLILSGFNM